MKKKMLLLACMILIMLILCACGRKEPEVVTIPATPATAAPAAATPTPEATPAPVQPAPTQLPFPTPMPVSAWTPTPAPVPTWAPTPAPVPVTPAPTRAPSNLPRITKNPTDETVPEFGKCQFVTRYENAEVAEWHFVSPDGSLDVTYKDVQNQFPTLKIIGGNTKDMTLENIPTALNGCRVYCRFSNYAGAVDSGSALITVIQRQGAPTPAARRAGFEGRWAEEIAGRCQITFTYRAEGGMNVDIRWSGSAWELARWQMTADVIGQDTMIYTDGHSWVETYSDNNSFTVSDETFGGAGSFFLQNGKLHWYDNQTGQETVLVPA